VLHAVNLAERAGPSPELARAYASMSVAAGVVQLHVLARSYAQNALEIARAEHDLPARAFVLVATSTYHGTMGNWATAQAGLLEGLEIAERLGDQRRWGEMAAGVAVVLYFQGAFDRLADWGTEMDRRARHADDPQRKAHVILGKIWYLMPQGRTDLAIEELQEATRLLAGRGSRTDEIIIYGVLALAHWRRQEEEQARRAAQRAAGLIAQSRPTAAYILEGYAGVTELYLDLWMAGDQMAARPAQQALAALRRFARIFRTARPRAWLYEDWPPTTSAGPDRPGWRGTRASTRPSDLGCPTSKDEPTTSSGDTPAARPSRATGTLAPRRRALRRHRRIL
jgi:tetratricopeptide (TPR) repeat protein